MLVMKTKALFDQSSNHETLQPKKTKPLINMLFFVFIQLFLLSPLFAQDYTNKILEAFELRTNGKIEKAQEMLNAVLEQDSTNAMAHFELARTSTSDTAKMTHIQKAILYDPDNATYKFLEANMYMLSAYKAMKNNQVQSITENLQKCCETLKSILEINPNCEESLLFLVDIYGSLPADMGGDEEQAKIYIERLKKVNPVYAAQGDLLLKSKESQIDMVTYWQDFMDKNGESIDALIRKGKASLLSNNIEQAELIFDKVISKDPSKKIVYLDIARAHLYNAMRGLGNKDTELSQFKKYIKLYLDQEKNKPAVVEAWCYGWLGRIEENQKNNEQAEKYYSIAKEIIPDFPKYTAIPTVDEAPNVIAYTYKSYFTPF